MIEKGADILADRYDTLSTTAESVVNDLLVEMFPSCEFLR
jgi:hypothetical protein